MNHAFFLLFIGAMLVGVVFMFLHWQKEKKRAASLQRLAETEGWQYLSRDHTYDMRLAAFDPFGRGENRYVFNVMRGHEDDGAFELMDHHYQVTTNTGKSRSTRHHYHKVCILQMPIPAPDLSIQEEHVGHKLFDALGGEDIDFESHEFSKRHWVRCHDRRFAYDVVHTGMMEFLLQVPGWHWQWKGHTLVVCRKGRIAPDDAKAMLGMALRFRRLVPRHLLTPAAPAHGARP